MTKSKQLLLKILIYFILLGLSIYYEIEIAEWILGIFGAYYALGKAGDALDQVR